MALPLRLWRYVATGRSHTVVRRGVLCGGQQCHGGHRRRATTPLSRFILSLKCRALFWVVINRSCSVRISPYKQHGYCMCYEAGTHEPAFLVSHYPRSRRLQNVALCVELDAVSPWLTLLLPYRSSQSAAARFP